MCGRFSIALSKAEVEQILNEDYQIDELKDGIIIPRFNISPGQEVLSVIHDGHHFRAGLIKWGFVPAFAKDEKSGFGMINAKAETIREKPAFRLSLKTKRCVILADGFYEWQKGQTLKQPMRIQVTNRKLFPMAGLWSVFIRPDGTKLFTCSIITCEANEMMTSIHDRMPVILTKETEKIWLNPSITDADVLSGILTPYESKDMTSYPVSNLVNSAANDSVEVIKKRV